MVRPRVGTVLRREEWIIEAVCWELDIAEERVRGRARDQETVQARHVLCYVLHRSGISVMEIARLLARDHSTIVHAIRKVECQDALVAEGRRLMADVLPFLDEPTQRGVAGAVPLKAVSRTLLRALHGTVLLRDLHAVRAYVCGTLLGRERVPDTQAAWGLQVVGAQPQVRAAVEEVLGRCGLAAYRGLIDLQLQRMGRR